MIGHVTSRDVTVTVRTGLGYPMDFLVDLGQRDVRIARGRLSPLQRFFRGGDAIGLVEPGADLVHSFNAVPVVARRPFIVTFEDYLPRTPDDRPAPRVESFLRRRLTAQNCVRIIAISEYARRQFVHQHRDYDRLPDLEQRLEVLRPAVRRRIDRPRAMPKDRIRLLAVGTDFMRKGLPAVVRAHQVLEAMGVPVETTIVSALRWREDEYVGPPSRAMYEEEVRRLQASTVRHVPRMANEEVLQLMDAADLFVFPSFHETFGFVAIEALAGGTPVIATDTCALPEVVEDGVNGYLLPFENDAAVGKWKWLYRNGEVGYLDAYRTALERFTESIVERVAAVWQERSSYEQLSHAALASVEDRFDVEAARGRLESLYAEALAH
jgi:glycosyltransferase involved in cell wall biosynthesis